MIFLIIVLSVFTVLLFALSFTSKKPFTYAFYSGIFLLLTIAYVIIYIFTK